MNPTRLLITALFIFVLNLFVYEKVYGQIEQFVFPKANESSYFPLVVDGKSVNILTDKQDDKGVLRAVADLKDDFRKVSGNTPAKGIDKQAIIISTVGKSVMIDRLIQKGKIIVQELKGKNEKYLITIVSNQWKI